MPMTRVAVAGLGAIGRVLVRRLAAGMPGFTLACAAARDHAKAQAWLDAERIMCQLIEPEAFATHADLAIECTPASVLERICRPMLEAGKQVMVLSAGALLAAAQPCRRALSGSERHFGRRAQCAQAGVLRHGARCRGGISRQRQRRGGAIACRHRAGPHHDGDLGRPLGRAQLP